MKMFLWQTLTHITLLAAFLVSSCATAAPIELSGEQDGLYGKADYLVTSDVIIRKDSTLTFEPGCIIRFRPQTALIVEGRLYCPGLADRQIVLLGARPSTGDTAQSRWRGIQVDSGASLLMSSVYMSGSSYGIKASAQCDSIGLQHTAFEDITGAAVRVGGTDAGVTKGKSVDYAYSFRTEMAGNAAEHARPPTKRWRTALRVTCASVAVVGVAAAVGGDVQLGRYADEYHKSRDTQRVDELHQKMENMATVRTIGIIVAGVGAAGFGVTLFF
jgi:hypothetical protein